MACPDGNAGVVNEPIDAATMVNRTSGLGHRSSLFLRSLPISDLRRIEPYLTMRTFAREEVIQHGGDVIQDVIFPHDMVCSLVSVFEDATTVETATVGTEGYVGVESMLGCGVANCSAIAQHGRASAVSLDRTLILMDQIPSLRAAMLGYAQKYLAAISRLVACNAIHTLKQRACRRLLLALDQTERRPILMTQEQLARALGVGRTSVNQACKELRENNIIEYSRGQIQVRDAQTMMVCACDCYQYLNHILLG